MDHETNGNFRKRTDVQGATDWCLARKDWCFRRKKYAKYCCKYQKMCKTIYVISMWSFTGE